MNASFEKEKSQFDRKIEDIDRNLMFYTKMMHIYYKSNRYLINVY